MEGGGKATTMIDVRQDVYERHIMSPGDLRLSANSAY